MRIVTLVALSMVAAVAAGQDIKPVVRAAVKPQTVTVGEPAELTITILVPTWFTRPPVYPSLELANAITRQPADNSYPLRERVGSESWSGIVRTYEIYPLLAASYRMQGQAISVTFANPGHDAVTATVDLPEITLRATVPRGAESLQPYLAGRHLDVSIDVQEQPDALKVGDAVVLTYSAELDGLPAIFIPPLAPSLEYDGVLVYPDEPVVTDGEVSRRSEKVTLVFNAGGEFAVPDLQLGFWNTSSKSIEWRSAAGTTFVVAGAAVAPPDELSTRPDQWRRNAMLGGIVFLLLLIVYRTAPLVAGFFRRLVIRRRRSERYAYRQFQRALRSRDSTRAYRALLTWLARLGHDGDARSFAGRFGNAGLPEILETLAASRYGDRAQGVDWRALEKGFRLARRQFMAVGQDLPDSLLPPLNP